MKKTCLLGGAGALEPVFHETRFERLLQNGQQLETF
jgi:hypothetical protein